MQNQSGRANQGILLEAGTNEAEILVFLLNGERFGVNVAKVREVLPLSQVTSTPNAHPAVDGVVRIRESVAPVVDLNRFLNGADAAKGEDANRGEHDKLLLLEFNQERLAFRVNGVDRIYRVSWKNTIPLPVAIGGATPVTSVILLGERIVPLLDFESVGSAVGMPGFKRPTTMTTPPRHSASQLPLVLAEDSPLVREMLQDALSEAGYERLHSFPDGEQAWSFIEQLIADHPDQPRTEYLAGVISDIEMPRMDGLNLTRRIREHAVLSDLPIILFSSLISRCNEKKGIQVGATAQIAKPRYQDLTEKLAEVLLHLGRS